MLKCWIVSHSALFFAAVLMLVLAQACAQSGRRLGDECIPGACSAINSNCKWQGSIFKCVCKEKYLSVNSTHCGKPVSNQESARCRDCLERDSLCLDFNDDDRMDECWCPRNETCGRKKQAQKSMSALRNADLAMILLDVTNNRPILDGTTVFLGDQVLIDIKSTSNDNGVTIHVENCSVSALTSAEDIMSERVDMLKRGCPVRNDMVSFSLNFRRISETHMESNVFDIFKLRSSSLILMNCWVQVCAQKNKCLHRVCSTETQQQQQSTTTGQRGAAAAANVGRRASFGRSAFDFLTSEDRAEDKNADEDEDGDGEDKVEFYTFKDAGVRINIEDPYGMQNAMGRSLKNEILPSVIELEFKSKPFSGLIKSAIVSAIAITFAIIVSILSIYIYRMCVRDHMLNMNSTTAETPISICQTSEECKYDMNARNLEESFFQNTQVEPLAAQSHGSRW